MSEGLSLRLLSCSKVGSAGAFRRRPTPERPRLLPSRRAPANETSVHTEEPAMIEWGGVRGLILFVIGVLVLGGTHEIVGERLPETGGRHESAGTAV